MDQPWKLEIGVTNVEPPAALDARRLTYSALIMSALEALNRGARSRLDRVRVTRRERPRFDADVPQADLLVRLRATR